MKDKYRQEVKGLSERLRINGKELEDFKREWEEAINSGDPMKIKPISIASAFNIYLGRVGETVLELERITKEEESSLQKAKKTYQQREKWDYPTLKKFMEEHYGIREEGSKYQLQQAEMQLTKTHAERKRKDWLKIMHYDIEAQEGIVNILNTVTTEGKAIYQVCLKQHTLLSTYAAEMTIAIICGMIKERTDKALEKIAKDIVETGRYVLYDEETIRRAMQQEKKIKTRRQKDER